MVADVPGLVEGAAEGRGLGHRFLRHTERARVLVLLLDLAAADGTTPEAQERILLDELRRYRPDLLDRPRLAVGSKADVATGDASAGESDVAGGPDAPGPALRVSGATGEGTAELLGRLATMVLDARAEQASEVRTIVVHRPVSEDIAVERADDGSFVVRGRPALRAVALSDLTDDGAVDYVQHRLRRLGVERALVRAGVRDGDVVHLGSLSFTYRKDEGVEGAVGPDAPLPARRHRRQRQGDG